MNFKCLNIKREFLKGFFEEINTLTYGVIDFDDNLKSSIENDIDVWVKKNNLKEFIDTLFKYAKSNGWIIKRMELSPRINSSLESKYAILFPSSPFCVIQLDVWVNFHWRSLPFLDCNSIIFSFSLVMLLF